MKKIIKLAAYFLVAGLVSTACRKDDQSYQVQNYLNRAPVADAGEDQVIEFPANSAFLEGKGADADGYILSYTWTLLSGPAALTIADSNNISIQVKDMVFGVYEFELKVTDNKMLFARDTVLINVIEYMYKSPWDY